MRLLVLDGSLVLQSLVRRLSPVGLQVEEATDFERAIAILASDPPDAMIVNIGPVDLPWRRLQAFCQQHTPKIPVLYESCVYQNADEAGLDSLNHSAYFLRKPYSLDQLRTEIARLVNSAGETPTPPETHH
jgi:DNA-binding NtrC family response regulator